MWSPKRQQVMNPTPHQPYKRYGIGGVNYHIGKTVVIVRRRKRRSEIAEFLELLLERHPHETIHVVWDKVNTHEDDAVEAMVRSAAGRLISMYLPTYRPWLNPIKMLWRHFRREVTPCELLPSIKALVAATLDFFNRYKKNRKNTFDYRGYSIALYETVLSAQTSALSSHLR